MTAVTDEYRIDKNAMRASFDRAAESYDDSAVLQREVCARMVERLQVMRVQPSLILDLGAGTGISAQALGQQYPAARIVALDIAEAMLRRAGERDGAVGRVAPVCSDMEVLPLAAGSVDMVFSNLALQWTSRLEQVLDELCRVLRPGGLLIFSTFGPDTLKELRASWSAADGFTHVNAFLDMHDVGDAVMGEGFAEPVMEVEHFTLTYTDPRDLMRDLKALGAHNSTAGRPRGLTGRRRLTAALDAYEQYRDVSGRLPATYEVVYGHAWAPQGAQAGGQGPGTAVDQMRRSMQVELELARRIAAGSEPDSDA